MVAGLSSSSSVTPKQLYIERTAPHFNPFIDTLLNNPEILISQKLTTMQ